MNPMRLLARLLRRAGVPVSGSRLAVATAAVQSPVHWWPGATAVPQAAAGEHDRGHDAITERRSLSPPSPIPALLVDRHAIAPSRVR